MENTKFNNTNNNTNIDEEAPFEFKNLLSEMFTSFPNQNPTTSNNSLENIPKIAFSCSSPSSNSSSSSHNNIISFGNNNISSDSYFVEDNNNYELDYDMITEKVMMSSSISNSSVAGKRICRSPLQSQEHLLAERKRRERFSQLFALLAKAIPQLKKLDKATILEDAIKYIGELQERVSALEEAAGTIKSTSTNLIETTHATLVHKQYSHVDDLECSKRHDENIDDIKVQILDKNVLIGIHCNKQMRSIFSIIAGIMEKLHLTIHHIRVAPSNHISLHYISILAEIDENVDIKVADVEKAFELHLLTIQDSTKD